MLIRVDVTPNAREASVVRVSEDYYEVRVDERAVGGRANKRLLEILAEHFKVPKSRITILKGTKTRHKTIQVVLERMADGHAKNIRH
jgi:uncharacterized protein